MSNVAAGKDTDDEGENLNNVETVLKKMGISLRDNIGEWRSFEEVLDDVAQKWKKFSDIQQSQISTAIAGTRQQEMFRALMNNYDQVGKLVNVAADSTGSASKRMEIYLESVEAKTNQLKTTWEEFIMSLSQSDSYKQFLDACIWILDNMPIVLQYGTSLLSLVLMFKSQKIAEGLLNIKAGIKDFIISLGQFAGVLTGNTAIISKNTAAKIQNTLADINLTTAEKTHQIATILETAGVKKETAAEIANNVVKKGSIAATTGLTTATSLLTLAIGALFAIVSMVSMAIANYNAHLSELSAQVDASASAVASLQEDIDKTGNAMGELSVIENEMNQKLITSEERITKLKTVEDELNSIYENKIGKIDLVNKGYKEQIGLVQQLNDLSLQEQLVEAQKGESARKELLNRDIKTYIGQTNDLQTKLSNETFNEIVKIAEQNNLRNGANIWGANFLEGKASDLKKFTNALEEYRKELIALGKTEKAQQIADFLNTGDYIWYKGLKNDTEATGSALEEQEKAEYLEFRVQNSKAFNQYQQVLTQRKSFVEDFNNKTKEIEELQQKRELASTEQEKKTYDTRIENAQIAKNKYYDLLTQNSQEVDEAKEKLFGLTDNENFLKLMKEQFSDLENIIAFKTDNIHIDKLKDKYAELYNSVKTLDDAFEKGQISAKQYFDEINKEIAKIDTTNLDEMSTAVESLFGNNLSYLDTFVGQVFGDSITDAQDVENLKAYTSNMSRLIQLLKDGNAEGGAFAGKINNEIFSGDGRTSEQRTQLIQKLQEQRDIYAKQIEDLTIEKAGLKDKEYKGVTYYQGKSRNYKYSENRGAYDVENTEGKIIPNSGFFGSAARNEANEEGYKQYKADLDEIEQSIDSATKAQELFDNKIKELENAGDGLDKYQSQLEEIQKILDEMDISSTQNAFKELEKGFEEGTLDNIITTLDQLPTKYRDAFSEVADDIVVALGSSNDEIRRQAEDSLQTLIGAEAEMMLQTVDFANLTEEQMSQVATDIANKTIVAQGGMSNALQTFAAEGNKIASTAMGQAIQTLGKMLEDVGNALEKIDVKIPVKIPNIKINVVEALAGAKPLVTLEGNSTDEIQIGGKGTTAGGFKDLANVLKNADYADALAKLQGDGNGSGSFNPYSFSPSSKKDTSGSGGKSGSSSKNSYSPEDAANDLASILNDIEKYEADIEADLEDQTEELINHYNLERNKLDLLKEELDYYDEIYDVTENTSKWLDTQLDILDEESKKTKEIINANDKIDKQRQKVYAENSQYNVSSWFDEAGNETLAYGDLLNSFEYRIEAIQRETAASMRAEYNAIANSTDKDTISDAKKRIKNIEEAGDLKVKELEKEREKVENIYDSVNKLNDAWKENQEQIREALKELNDRVKSIRDELIDDIMEQLERAVDKMNTSIEKDVTRLEQLKQVQQSYNDILNDTIDTHQELEDELRANMDTYQYLDETMRQLMFNEDDYKQLSSVIEGIQSDIAEIWEDHYNQIQNLTEDEMYKAEYITQETERQLAMKQREYDIAKAELDVAKAQTNLQNVLNERNVRILGTDGQWSWVANPDDVKNARQQLADAEREKTRLEREKEQQKLIDVMDKMIDSDNLQIDRNNDLLEKIQEAIERETEEVKSVEEALLNAEGANLPALTTTLIGALGEDGGYMKELLGQINHSQLELAAALRGQTIEQAEAQLRSGNLSQSEFESLRSRLGYGWDETTGEIVTQDGRFKASYKGFTINKNNDIQLQTAHNGVQVTGNGGQQQSSSTTDIASANARASEEELMEIARQVWQGRWGNGQDRRNRLTAAGYDYEVVQALVNKGRSYLFDQGGVATNIGLLAKDTIKPERVLSPRQTKAFENLVSNLTSNPVLAALSRIPNVTSNFNGLETSQDNSKKYYFSNFTVKANNIEEFIDSIETMMPMKR